jgi:hypothetical protein
MRAWINWLGQRPRLLVELFVLTNFAGLAVDIYFAHSMNHFHHWSEWVPFYFSLAVPPVLGIAILSRYGWARRALDQMLGWAIGAAAVIVGVAGMVLHLDAPLEQMTLKQLVYSAPFAAPLAYAGLGLLLILNRTEDAEGSVWPRWVLLLAWGGFVGNFALSLVDHEQIGFFEGEAWLSVVASAIAVGFVLVAALMRVSRGLLWSCAAVLGLQVVIGLMGFGYHLVRNLQAPGPDLFYKLVHFAPTFAPLLFPNLALLAAIGLWALARAERPGSVRQVAHF